MTHEQLVRRIAKREGVSIRDAARIARSYGVEIAAALARGERATIHMVGTLTPAARPGGRTRFRSSDARRDGDAGSAAGGDAAHARSDANRGCGPDRDR